MQKTDSGGRYDFLDLLKASAIFSVILYHSFTAPYHILENAPPIAYFRYFFRSILSTCVPIFFLVNGALLLTKPFDLKKHLRRTGIIFLLATVWAFLDILLLMPVRGEFLPPQEVVRTVFLLKGGWCNHLWYLYTLVVVYLFVPLLKMAFDTNRPLFNLCLGLALFFSFGTNALALGEYTLRYFVGPNLLRDFMTFLHRVNPLAGINGYAVAYFMLGGVLMEQRDRLRSRKVRISAALLIPVMMFLWFFYATANSRREGRMLDIVFDGYSTVFILVCTVSLFALSLTYQSRGKFGALIRVIGANTLGIYLLQTTVIAACGPLVRNLTVSRSMLFSIGYAAALLLLCLGICLVCKKTPVLRRLFRL